MFEYHIWSLYKLFVGPLFSAVYKKSPEIVKLLLDQKGIDINAKNINSFYLKFVSDI